MNEKTNFKGFVLGIEIIAIIVSIVCACIIFNSLLTKVRYEAEYIDKSSYYEDSGYNLTVSGATLDQVDEFKTKDFINNIASASRIDLKIKTKSTEDYRNVIIFEKEEDLKYTEFTKERILKETNSSKNYIYADYKFCELYNVDLGSTLKIIVSGIEKEYVISRVYRTDYTYSEGILIGLKDNISISATKAQYVYLASNNTSELKTYLNDFKPMGTFLEKTSSQTEEEYQKYVNEFNAKNYYSTCVTELNNNLDAIKSEYEPKIDNANKRFNISVGIVTLIVFLTSLISFLVNAKNKKDRIYKYIQENGNAKIIKIFNCFNFSFMLFIELAIIVTMLISLRELTTYYTLINIIKSSFIVMILPIASIFVSYIITLVKIKRA